MHYLCTTKDIIYYRQRFLINEIIIKEKMEQLGAIVKFMMNAQ